MSSGKKAKKQRQQKKQPIKRPADDNRSSPAVVKQWLFSSRYTLLSLALIIVIGLLVYGNTFNAPFVFDDDPNILNNPFIRVTHLSVDELKGVLHSRSTFRPLANLTFALNYYFHQYDETGYHIVNVMIHLINAFLVFLITRQTLRLCRVKDTWIAIPTALLWLVNPVHTQSVTYIVQRMNALAAMFYLLAMVGYIQGRLIQRRGSDSSLRPILLFAVCLLAGLLGLASKEITATLPVMIFLYEWYFFQDLDKDWFKKQVRWIIVMLLALIVVTLIYLKGKPLTELASIYARKDFTLAQRLLTEPGVVLYYLSLLVFPSPDRLRIIYHFSHTASIFSMTATLLSFFALAALIVAALVVRHRDRLVSFAIVWFLVNLVIESSIIPLALAFEHRTYLPSTFLFIATTYLLFTKTTFRKASAVLCVAVIIICGFWTWHRNAVWSNKISFWSDATKKIPDDPRTHNNLGEARVEKGELEAALYNFRDALDQDDTYETAYTNIGSTLIALNRPAEAVPHLEKAIVLKPDFYSAYYNLGVALNDMGYPEKAESNYLTALELNPLLEAVHNNLGIIKMDRGQFEEAMTHFSRVLTINPDYEKAYINMGIACFRKGKIDRALTCLKKALALNPGSAEAAGNLNDVNRVMGQFDQAIAQLQQALQQHPDNPSSTLQLAAVCRQAGMRDLAVDLYEQTLSRDPRCEKCLDALAGIYEATTRYHQAAQMLERLALLYPDKPNIFYGLARVYAQDNQKQKAVESLQKALEKGFTDIDSIRNDNALTVIRDTDYFQTLTGGGKN